jgi:hypothetical protein
MSAGHDVVAADGRWQVRGNPSAEEMAAVLATLRRPVADVGGEQDPYLRWRRARRAALRRHPA